VDRSEEVVAGERFSGAVEGAVILGDEALRTGGDLVEDSVVGGVLHLQVEDPVTVGVDEHGVGDVFAVAIENEGVELSDAGAVDERGVEVHVTVGVAVVLTDDAVGDCIGLDNVALRVEDALGVDVPSSSRSVAAQTVPSAWG
jgi:hypothetical protein